MVSGCARALGASAQPATIPALLRLAGHQDPLAAGTAAVALARCGHEDPEALTGLGLVLAAADDRALIATAGLVHLGRIGAEWGWTASSGSTRSRPGLRAVLSACRR